MRNTLRDYCVSDHRSEVCSIPLFCNYVFHYISIFSFWVLATTSLKITYLICYFFLYFKTCFKLYYYDSEQIFIIIVRSISKNIQVKLIIWCRKFFCFDFLKYLLILCCLFRNFRQNHLSIMDFYFQEEALRQKRLASSRSEAASSAVTSSSNRNEAFSVSAMNPDATALSTTYIYAALVVLVLGIIIGKWIFWTIT